jgi:hypothetical protein
MEKPRRLTAFHQYFKSHYHSDIKKEFCRRFNIAKTLYDKATETEREEGVVKKPIPVQVRTEVGKEIWNLQTPKFREDIAREAEVAHAHEVELWEKSKATPRTPQQFHQ